MTEDHQPGGGPTPPDATPDGPPPPAAPPVGEPPAAPPWPAQGAPVAATGPGPAQPAAKRPGRLRAIFVIVAIVAVLGVILFAVRNNVDANDLKVGDCFTIPDGTTVQTVEKHPCTETHNAEVVFVGEYSGDTFPISLSLESYVRDNCVPASESYVGRSIDDDPALSIGYFSPSQDSWNSGDRTVSCYVAQPDERDMTESLKQ